MPIYEYKCSCGEVSTVIKPMPAINRQESCKCGELMQRQLTLSIPLVFKPYWSENLVSDINPDGVWVESQSHKKQLMKEANVIEAPARSSGKGKWL